MAAAAYRRYHVTIGDQQKMHFVYTTNTLASVLVANFFDAELGKFSIGDPVMVFLVDDLTKYNTATWAVTGFQLYVVVGAATHVDLAIAFTGAWTNAT